MRVVRARTPHRFENTRFYTFDTISLVPLQRSLIVVEMLSADERAWVDAYHARVLREVGDGVVADDDDVDGDDSQVDDDAEGNDDNNNNNNNSNSSKANSNNGVSLAKAFPDVYAWLRDACRPL